eukprot:scaffold11251_cov112-Isochrysis_galbana.AAC.3
MTDIVVWAMTRSTAICIRQQHRHFIALDAVSLPLRPRCPEMPGALPMASSSRAHVAIPPALSYSRTRTFCKAQPRMPHATLLPAPAWPRNS